MKKIFYFSFTLLLAGLVFFSCKKEPCSTINIPFAVVGDSVITAGDTIHLKATTLLNANYTWTGPNGFTSSSAEIFIPANNVNYAGTYNVVATDGKCINEA